MRKKYVGCGVWLLLACLLYFFENNTGTRIVLLCSLLLPAVPVIRRVLFGPDEAPERSRAFPQTVRSFADREEDDPGGVRVYQPGDPVNRIHWKLSAKRDELLVREQAECSSAEEAVETEAGMIPGQEVPGKARSGNRLLLPVLTAVLSLLLLLILPSARLGAEALLNRLYDASEAVNAYAYEHFDVPAGQPMAFAVFLLAAAAFSLSGMAVLSGRRWPVLCLMAGIVLFQVYFGLAFPAWVNVPLFAFFALRMLRRPLRGETVRSVLAGILLLSLAVLILWPGVDAPTEAASEAARDRLSRMAQSLTGAVQEAPADEKETRHVHTQSLTAGNQEARADREYRLVTLEEEQISMPHWVNYLRIALLLISAVAVVVLPFAPFLWLNRRRKKILESRKVFQSENVSEAIVAVFRQITAWLEAAGNGGGNLPYAQWDADLSAGYAERFAQCERLFEEAAYSTHEMREEQRQQVLELLKETERVLWQRANRKQRLRLRYRENLWV